MTHDPLIIALVVLIALAVICGSLSHFFWKKELDDRIKKLVELRKRKLCTCNGDNEDCCCQQLEPVVNELPGRLRHALDLLRRGDVKDARHELERVVEDVEVYAV